MVLVIDFFIKWHNAHKSITTLDVDCVIIQIAKNRLTKEEKCDKINKSLNESGDHTKKLLKKTPKKGLTRARKCDIIDEHS